MGTPVDPADPLLPLGELSRLLELPLDLDVANGVASGRIGESQRPITIDLKSGQALIGGKAQEGNRLRRCQDDRHAGRGLKNLAVQNHVRPLTLDADFLFYRIQNQGSFDIIQG